MSVDPRLAERAVQRVLSGYVKKTPNYPALLGDGNGNVAIANRPGYVHIRTGNDETLGTAFNQRVPLRDDLPIVVGYTTEQPDLFQVLTIREVYIGSDDYTVFIPQVVGHGDTHTYGGGDEVYIFTKQIMALLVFPTDPATMTVNVSNGWYPWLSTWHYFEDTVSANLAGSVPVGAGGEARYTLISIDGATEALQYTDGDIFPAWLPPADTEDMIPGAPLGSIPLAAVALVFGQTTITGDDIYDLGMIRQPVGGSVTPGVHDHTDATQGGVTKAEVLTWIGW